MLEATGLKKVKLRGAYRTIAWQRHQVTEWGRERQNAQAMAEA